MLTGVKRIKGLGVFGNFAAPSDLPPFARYNIIYGENGSGKTTLSRLFAVLDTGTHPEFAGLEYALDSQLGALTQGQPYDRKVRVFNADYVQANIGQFQGPLRHILIIGEENKALAEEAATEKALYDERTRAITAAQAAAAKLDADKGKIFSAIAKTIGEATSGSTLRSYRKPDAEKAFGKVQAFATLDEASLEAHRATIHQEQLDAVTEPELPLPPPKSDAPFAAFAEVTEALPAQVAALLARTAQAGALRRLVEEPEVARWVEEGVAIHGQHGWDRCEFCDQPLPAERMARLAQHFGIEDQRLKADIESARRTVLALGEGLAVLALPVRTALYGELRIEFDAACETVERCRSALAAEMDAVLELLDEKLLHRATAYERDIALDPAPLTAAITTVSAIVARHNAKTAGFERARSEARKAIELHYLSTIVDQVREHERQIAGQQALFMRLTDGAVDLPDPRGLAVLKGSYEAKQAKVSSEHAGGAALTERLKTFLGRTDLHFKSGTDGYHVQRRGRPAKRLSEGEKTAIAFLYFIVQLGDQDFDLAEGIVVIDDPISSMDAASIYQAFSFLKNAVRDARQVFVLTHNFDFLKLLLNWVSHFRKADKSLYMVICTESGASRDAVLKPLDPLLRDHPTEYCYLFKLLHDFESDGTIVASYHIPNIARKVLETFLEFQRPHERTLYAQLEAVNFDPHKKTAIYKFANDLSHFTGKGFDPALVAETQKNVAYLLEMVQAVAPEHYESLKKLGSAA
ncbi:hypothetical protein B5C34_02690 [Pacificimonas flava]|uniref:Protein CR006 P-loop domain-containing protein n=2 Tax=Pacificimonas TaxID=1960290 RepID=A0A219B294_9SPHN|nr:MULTISPECIES: AAA family ATPase [Pacificimonas]MBZ6377871.1 AAA family ATPase [Pacificimonas aurantium]OWV32467.1 hypothetical protein B5C34_02690 [Pacificimonas flava]